MAFMELNIFSESLGTQQVVYVVMPQSSTNGEIGIGNGSGSNTKCLYLLHGLSDNHSIWLRRTSVERYAQEYGLCIVMPFGDRSFYTDMKHGGKYYTYIANELPKILGNMLNISVKREDNFIAGLSMGGYGALKIGLRECDRFSAAAGLSSVADINFFKERLGSEFVNIFGEVEAVPAEEDLFALAEKCNSNPNKPRIFMGVGTEDYLYEGNQKLKAKFETLDFDYTYKESAGVHNWVFWDEYIQYVLAWLFNK